MRVNGEFGVARYSISGGGAELDLSRYQIHQVRGSWPKVLRELKISKLLN